MKPDYAEAYYNKGSALDDLNEKEEAIKCFDNAIALKPDYAEAYNNRGSVLNDLENRYEAIECF